MGQRQLPGNARAADRWSAAHLGSVEWSEGCALLDCQQAVADWPGRSRPAHRTRQRRQLHALVRQQILHVIYIYLATPVSGLI